MNIAIVLPFVALLLSIALGPVLFENIWHKHYPKISFILSLIIIVTYLSQGEFLHIVHSITEYIQFISLISALFIVTGGISLLNLSHGAPISNTILLTCGAIISNLIGTTGASMLLLVPYIKMNKRRIKPYHILFFIFIVSNVGGALTPIGDPPLFIGFMKGIPFFWTLKNCFGPWLFMIICLLIIFFVIDSKNHEPASNLKKPIIIIGKKNLIWLPIIVLTVFIDPNIFNNVPAIEIGASKISFIRELLLISYSIIIYKRSDPKALKENNFSIEPLKEISIIFIGIFITMMPAIELIENFSKSDLGQKAINVNFLYWGTGFLSSFLDNAPTYLNFLAAGMGAKGLIIDSITDVNIYANSIETIENTTNELKAISLASVFFGAMTYIGNGPNMMVKSIAQHNGIKMPSFFGYIFNYSAIILLPLLAIVWFLFIYLS